MSACGHALRMGGGRCGRTATHVVRRKQGDGCGSVIASLCSRHALTAAGKYPVGSVSIEKTVRPAEIIGT
jgi:hypothetical protein